MSLASLCGMLRQRQMEEMISRATGFYLPQMRVALSMECVEKRYHIHLLIQVSNGKPVNITNAAPNTASNKQGMLTGVLGSMETLACSFCLSNQNCFSMA